MPKANAEYWTAKIGRNMARDRRVQAELAEAGWRPLVVWECELKDEAVLEARLRAELGL
jgi:DNA mismatch endonuclease (patch repair protein)